MSEETALVEIQRLDVAVIFTEVGMTTLLSEIDKKARGFTPDLSTDSGRKEIASMAYKVARSKTLIDDVGKKSMEELKQKIDDRNKYRKQARDYLDNLKDEVRKPLTEWEAEQDRIKEEAIEKEKARVEGIQNKISEIISAQNVMAWTTANEMEAISKNIREFEFDFQEFKEQGENAIKETLVILSGLIAKRCQFEKEETERKAEAERLEKQKKDQAEAQDKIDAENKRIADEKAQIEREKKAEQDRKDREAAIAKAKEEAKLEAERAIAEKAEREKREAEEKEIKLAEAKAHFEAMKPDKEKLIAYAQALQNVPKPQVKISQAQSIMDDAARDVRTLVNRITRRSEEL